MNETFHWNDRELLRYLGCKNGTAPDQNTADPVSYTHLTLPTT